MSTRRVAALLVTAISLPGWGYSQSLLREHFEITVQHVAQTLSNSGIQIADLRVSLLAKVVAAEANPELDVLSIEPLGLRRSKNDAASSYMVKLGCHAVGMCLPFYAIASLNQGTAGSQTSAPIATLAAANTFSKPNTHATLVMYDGDAQIEVAVVSLENGVAGRMIHVASPDHKQIYLAEVVSPTLLTRSF
jgi:hypothetical protein